VRSFDASFAGEGYVFHERNPPLININMAGKRKIIFVKENPPQMNFTLQGEP
jgi:hypothetical protein